MAAPKIAGQGRKRPQFDLLTESLLLDPYNPRLPNESKGKSQEHLLSILKRDFDLDEIAFSISENGYFDEEPLVAIPIKLPEIFLEKSYQELLDNKEYLEFLDHKDTQFYVVEGNRRLSTIKILLSSKLRTDLRIRNWPDLTDEVEYDIGILPVIIYPTRKEVLPYLGVRHITGILKWEPYAKAVYIADMIKQGYSIDSVQKQVGDRSNSAKKTYLSYQLIEEAQNLLDLDVEQAKSNFSLLNLAVGQANIKSYLGLPTMLQNTDFDQPVPTNKIEHLKDVFIWLFGDGRGTLPVIRESRDITNFLSPVLAYEESISHLKDTGDLREAFDRSNGEESLLLKKLQQAKRALGSAVGLVSRHKSDSVRRLIEECSQSIIDIKRLLK